MGFLDNSSITVDAVLTKKGRELLKTGAGLSITQFTVSDQGIDYTLWNPDHPSGSTYYGEALENAPQLEANVHSVLSMRNRLITLPPNTISVPALEVKVPGSVNNVMTLEESDAGVGNFASVVLKGYAPGSSGAKLYAIMTSPTVCTIQNATLVQELSGFMHNYVREANMESAKVYRVNGASNSLSNVEWSLNIRPGLSELKPGRSTLITLIEEHTGAMNEIQVTNNITKLTRNVLGAQSTKG